MDETASTELSTIPEDNAAKAAALWRSAQSSLQRLLLQDGLYRWIDLEAPEGIAVQQMLDNDVFMSFDLYCPSCKMVTTYKINSGRQRTQPVTTRYGSGVDLPFVLVLNAVCLRVQHYFTYTLWLTKSRLTKIGQFPSLADIAFGELKEVDQSLDPQDRKEIGRALGLFAHDAPLGAFVYLRRVFERMILRAHDRHVQVGGEVVADFVSMRMEDRIEAVRDQLPAKVVQNRRVFAVLSKGIHELSDEEGRELFPLLKSVIFQMLGDEERLRQAREQEATTDAALVRAIERFS